MKTYWILLVLIISCLGHAADKADVGPEVIQQELRKLIPPSDRILNDPRLSTFVNDLEQLRIHLNYGSPLARHMDQHLSAIQTFETYYRTHNYAVTGQSLVDFNFHVVALFAGFMELFPRGYTVADIIKNNTADSFVDVQAISLALTRLAIPRRFPTQAELDAFSERLRALMTLIPEKTRLATLIKPRAEDVERARKDLSRTAYCERKFVNQMIAFKESLNKIFGGYYDTQIVQSVVRPRGRACKVEMASNSIAGEVSSEQ